MKTPEFIAWLVGLGIIIGILGGLHGLLVTFALVVAFTIGWMIFNKLHGLPINYNMDK